MLSGLTDVPSFLSFGYWAAAGGTGRLAVRGGCLRLVHGEKICFEKEKQSLTGCGKPISVGLHSVRASLSLVVCVKGDCAAVWLFLRACLAQVIGTEAATAPRSAVLKCGGTCVAVLVVLRKEAGKEMSSCYSSLQKAGVVCWFKLRAGG